MQDELSRKQDDDAIARTQAGDAAAFDELIVKYSPRLYGLVYNMTSNHEDTNDLMQDIWAKAFRSITGFRGKSSFYTWIHSIGVNMTINFLKKRGRRFHMSLDDVDANIQNDKEFIELTAAARRCAKRIWGAAEKVERGYAEAVERPPSRGDDVRYPGHAARGDRQDSRDLRRDRALAALLRASPVAKFPHRIPLAEPNS
jgi:RNA polymerase sigma factor (sigma-70 family)